MANDDKDKENREAGHSGEDNAFEGREESLERKEVPKLASPEIESLNKAINDLIELNNALMKLGEKQNNQLFIIKLAIVVIIILLILGGIRFSPYDG